MKIDGKLLSRNLLKVLRREIKRIKRKKVIPHLAVVYVGNDKAALSYIKQKQKSAKIIGAKLTLHHFRKFPSYQKLAEYIHELSANPLVHGVIVQRPLPPSLSAPELNKLIALYKDVDGFRDKSPFLPPIGMAILTILNEIYFRYVIRKAKPKIEISKSFTSWLKKMQLVLIGRGETGGQPIAKTLSRTRINFIILTSKSENSDDYLKSADIIVSAVGKPNVIKSSQIKPGVILISVGLHTEKSKLAGDYDENEIFPKASFYTPTPGGVGPVNVACLMQNLVTAFKYQLK